VELTGRRILTREEDTVTVEKHLGFVQPASSANENTPPSAASTALETE